MKRQNITALSLFITCLTITSCHGQANLNAQYLKLEKEIVLDGVKGRIDHIDIDIKDQIAYVAALGNNTVEIVDLKKGTVIHSIKGLDEPQGVAYISKHNEIFVANGGTGECDFYNAADFKKTASVKFSDDADDARYDAASDKIFVGYGTGGIGIIDATTHKITGYITLPAHPESFQLDTKEGTLWINLPGASMIVVADIKEAKLKNQWKKLLPRSNFPMAYDETGHRLMIGYRFPATLKIIDSHTGEEIFSAPMVGDADDLYWDEKTKQIFVSGGGGAINIFKQAGSTYKLLANIKTPDGARTSLLIPELRLFILATRKNGADAAKLLVYKLPD